MASLQANNAEWPTDWRIERQLDQLFASASAHEKEFGRVKNPLGDSVPMANWQKITPMRCPSEQKIAPDEANYAMGVVRNITMQKEPQKSNTSEFEVGREHGDDTYRLQEELGEQVRDNHIPDKRNTEENLSMRPTTSNERQIGAIELVTEDARKYSNEMRRLFDSGTVRGILKLSIVFSVLSSGSAGEPCQSPQYLQLGSTGTINCTFEGEFAAIAWFNSTSTQDDPLTTISDDGGKSGVGFGEFDITENGSLLILNVSLQHDHTFCVATIVTPRGVMFTYCVDVVTVVFPEQTKPLIADFHNCSEGVCFAQYFQDSIIPCSVENAKPAVNLTWAVRSGSTDQTIPHQSSRGPSPSVTGAFSSIITLGDPFMYSKTLVLAVCKATSQPNLLYQNESLLLLQNMASDLPHVAPDPLYAAVKSTVVLNCPQMEKSLLVWLRKREDPQHMEMVAYVIFGESLVNSSSKEMYTLNPEGSLVISEVSVESRGTYICLAVDDEHEEAQSYHVHVYVPAFSEVEGCGPQGYCVLLAEEYDKLTCVMRGVLEGVRLGFTPIYPQEASITFLMQVVEIRNSGDFIDMSLTATYRASGSGVSTFRCGVVGEHKELFSHSTIFSLYVEPASNTTSEGNQTNYKHGFWMTAFIVSVALLALSFLAWIGFCITVRFRGRNTSSKKAHSYGRCSHADIQEVTDTVF